MHKKIEKMVANTCAQLSFLRNTCAQLHTDTAPLHYAGYVDDLMQDVVERCEHSSYKESFLSCEKSPPCYMSLGFERPSKQELIAQRRTRFPVASTLSNSS